ncbi:MAG: hypothetical protein WCJ51_00270 [Candidatus Moraniibacteriota bacterium]
MDYYFFTNLVGGTANFWIIAVVAIVLLVFSRDILELLYELRDATCNFLIMRIIVMLLAAALLVFSGLALIGIALIPLAIIVSWCAVMFGLLWAIVIAIVLLIGEYFVYQKIMQYI